MGENVDVIKTYVFPSVGVVCGRKQEMGRVIDSRQGVVLHCGRGVEDKLERASFILRLDRAPDGEVGAQEHLRPLLLGLRDPVSGGREGDDWLSQQIC